MIDARTTIAEVCEDHGVTPAQIFGRSHARVIVHARWAFAYEMWEKGCSYKEIAAVLKQDYSTIAQSVRNTRARKFGGKHE